MNTDKRERRLTEAFITVGGVLLLFGAAVRITGWEYAPYLFAVGSLMFASGQFADRYEGSDPVIKRLRRQQLAGAVFLLVSAVLMFTDSLHVKLMLNSDMSDKLRSILLAVTRRNNWILTLSIAAVFELYSSFRIDRLSRDSES